MAIYLVTNNETEEKILVEAKTKAAGLRVVTEDLYTVETVSSVAVAQHMKNDVKFIPAAVEEEEPAE